MVTQAEKGSKFQELHARAGAFILANAWDAGSARLLEHCGFEAIATTSAGFAFSIGEADRIPGRDSVLANAADIVRATSLPVSADLKNAFGTEERAVFETITLAGAAGLAGASLEDVSYDPGAPLLPLERARELVRAAVEAARAHPFPFLVTARAENYLVGRADLADVIQRLQAYQEAGADVLYAPGLTREDDIRTVVRSVDRPVNVVMGLSGAAFSLAELSRMGVKRVSVGSALARRAYGALLDAAQEMREEGTFTFGKDAAPFAVLERIFAR
ncbi:MAG TPA: isocitrate lyase/phosphoenolpyruvate mutase family protein [Polyangiaceae bacterium]|nr:isocitrate lyase/phosphoenolpyruvate mutase family protein [Polyangiaceae bacterium]